MAYEVIASQAGLEPLLLALVLLGSTAAFAELGLLARWQNSGKAPAILYSADILPPAIDKHTI